MPRWPERREKFPYHVESPFLPALPFYGSYRSASGSREAEARPQVRTRWPPGDLGLNTPSTFGWRLSHPFPSHRELSTGVWNLEKSAHTRTQSADWDAGTYQNISTNTSRTWGKNESYVCSYFELILSKFCVKAGRNREEGERGLRNFTALDGQSRRPVCVAVSDGVSLFRFTQH